MSKFIINPTFIFLLTMSTYANADPIHNLERERAKTLDIVLDKSISIEERKKQLDKSKMRLLDLERITINNKNISENPGVHTIKAFENFDLTFLVHTSIEKNKPLSITWFEKIGLTTENIMNTKVSRR